MLNSSRYQEIALYLQGSNISKIWVTICSDCGAIVGNRNQHNRFHEELKNGQKEGVVAGTASE